MVQFVILETNGNSRTLKALSITRDTVLTGANIAKLCRKTKAASVIGIYTWNTLTLTLWGWKDGKAGTENKHELPPPHDEVLLFSDSIISATENNITTDFTNEQYLEFYNDAFKGFEDLDEEDINGDMEEMDEEIDVLDDEVEAEVEVEEAEEADAEEAEEAEEAEADESEDDAEEVDIDEDCYEDGEDGGGGKRRAPRRRTAQTPDNRRIDMGLRSRIKIPSPLGKRAPRWQSAPELEPEEY